MTLAVDDPAATRTARGRGPGFLTRLIARPGFQNWASRFALTRGKVRKDGEKLFEIVSGFVRSQVLFAIVSLDIPKRLMRGSARADTLANELGIDADRMQALLQAGTVLGLFRRDRKGRFHLARLGAALVGVPGLQQMIRHHDVLYRDLADPVAFLRGQTEPELAGFWPYVFGAGGAADPQIARTYSDLMAQSQGLVADDTLRMVDLRGCKHLLDVGGGTGAFAQAALRALPALRATVMDLPPVVEQAHANGMGADLSGRLTFHPGSFRDDPLPGTPDAVSLIRVLYDHRDDTVRSLLAKIYDVLPTGGRLIVSEPMSGGDKPDPAGDVYFAFYCMAMGTGRARSQARIAELCREAGFTDIATPRPMRSFVTSCVTAVKTD